MLRRSITPVLYFAATVYFAENVVKHKNIDFRIFFSGGGSPVSGQRIMEFYVSVEMFV